MVRHILVAEDQPALRELAAALLQEWGYHYSLATNGAEAVTLAQRYDGNYDLGLFDVNMPYLSGCQATRVIRHTTRYFPIMALTAGDQAADCFAAGMDDVLAKPYDTQDLYDRIKALTVKAVSLHVCEGQFYIEKERPVSQKHLEELRRLREKGLTKLAIHGSGTEFIVDQRIQNKISYDLIGQQQELSEFLDYSEDKPGLCHLYKANFMVSTNYLLPEELEVYKKKEKEILQKCGSIAVKPLEK